MQHLPSHQAVAEVALSPRLASLPELPIPWKGRSSEGFSHWLRRLPQWEESVIFFLMRKAIAPLLNMCSDQLPTNSRYPWVPRTFVWSRSSVPWPVKTQAKDMPKMFTRTLVKVTRPPANSCPLGVYSITKGKLRNGDSVHKTSLSSQRLVEGIAALVCVPRQSGTVWGL